MDTSRKSTLLVWRIEPLGAGKIGIQCPYDGCGEKAVVKERTWRAGRRVHGFVGTRSCTYCFRTAWISQDLKDENASGGLQRTLEGTTRL